jgi:hypothetical protein
MEWRFWLLMVLMFETAAEGLVANRPGSIEAQRTPESQKPMYKYAIHQPVVAQEILVLTRTGSRNFAHEPEVTVGLVFHFLNPKHEAERSYVQIPLRQRLRAGTEFKPLFPSRQSPDPD